MQEKPIGIFDSGLGGLTVVKEIVKIMPHEDIVYLGDTARVPYGTRSKEAIVKFSFEDAKFLLTKKVKCIIIACNTSSALAGRELKNTLKIPVFDVVTPTVRYAQDISKMGRIGVIGTRGTIGSNAYKVLTANACPLFVPFIEEEVLDGKALELIAKDYLHVFKKQKIDTLIMGCTHYPIIKKIIQKIIGKKVRLVDPAIIIAKQVKDSLTEKGLLNNQKRVGSQKFYVTDLTGRFIKVAEMFLGKKININLEKVEL